MPIRFPLTLEGQIELCAGTLVQAGTDRYHAPYHPDTAGSLGAISSIGAEVVTIPRNEPVTEVDAASVGEQDLHFAQAS